jgi:hypothetical protein
MKREEIITKYICDVCGAEHIPIADKVKFSISKYNPWIWGPHGAGGNMTSKYEDLCHSCNAAFSEGILGILDKIKNKEKD